MVKNQLFHLRRPFIERGRDFILKEFQRLVVKFPLHDGQLFYLAAMIQRPDNRGYVHHGALFEEVEVHLIA